MTTTLSPDGTTARHGEPTMDEILFELRRLIVGQDHLLECLLVALLARGHVLLEGVPGLAKTATVKALARVVGGTFGRIQFTPDLVPADLVGTRIFTGSAGHFQTELGPVFANLLLADEFAGVREYQPGDDIRRIDWNLTARSNTPFIREAQADGAIDVWLVVDVSPSVDWGTGLCLKRYRAIELAAVAGQLLGRHGNRLGLLLFADRPIGLVPPATGRAHLERVVGRLRLQPRSGSRGPTDLSAALDAVRRLARRPSLIVLTSDFLVPDGWAAPLRLLAQRHEVVAARLRDARESSLPDVGLVTFEDPETGEQLTVNTSNPRLRERFNRAAEAQTQRIETILAGCGVDQVVLGTDEPMLPALATFLDARRRRRGARWASRPGPSAA